MKKFIISAIVCAAVAFGLARLKIVVDHPARASFVADTPSSPFISLAPDPLCKFWSNQALANAVTTDAQWTTAMGQIFSAANWPGVNATSLAFLRSFFVQYVHVGP